MVQLIRCYNWENIYIVTCERAQYNLFKRFLLSNFASFTLYLVRAVDNNLAFGAGLTQPKTQHMS